MNIVTKPRVKGWMSRLGFVALGAALLHGGSHPALAGTPELRAAAESIRSDDLLQHIKVLASDDFEGRAPGGVGEERTVAYLVEQFKRLGLRPGNPDGRFIQNVPMIGSMAVTECSFVKETVADQLQSPQDYVAWSPRYEPLTEVLGSELVFVGYGVVAPEYGWDDYKGMDVRGKTLVMLVSDPPIPDPQDPSKLDDRMFKGKAMTYYGRWTYKYEIAAEKGAAAAIVIHETGPAGYPYFVVVNSWGRENFGLKPAAGQSPPIGVASWISHDRAKKLFSDTGRDLDAMKKDALRRDFKPVPLGIRANFRVRSTLREVQSRNVLGLLEGSDSALKREVVAVTAHWDHLGKNEKLEGDQIFNGALDNASGTAALLELVEAFQKAEPRPKRSLLFLAVTGEEQGLLGAKYYAQNPLYAIEKTVANLNIDGVNQWGKTKDIIVIGRGNSTLEDWLEVAARGQGRDVKADAEPEKGYYFRSDHFEFAKVGVPALYLDEGADFIGREPEYGMRKRKEYTEKDYHKVSDEVKPDWDLSGAVEDLKLLLEVGYAAANSRIHPEWKAGSEFKARRDELKRKTR